MALWKSRHWHLGVSIGVDSSMSIGIAEILFLPYKIFNEKVKHQCQKILIFFLIISYLKLVSFLLQ